MDYKLASTVGTAARAARLRLHLTQADVAERIGIANEVYGRLERGTMLPSVNTLRKLCEALGTSADELLGFNTLPSKPTTPVRPRPQEAPLEVRRLMRRIRTLERRKVRLLGLIAAEMSR